MLMPAKPIKRMDGRFLGLRATRPIELVIEANDDRVEIGAYADRGNRVEIVVLGAEIVEVIFDLAREVFDQTEFDAGADGETGASVGKDLRRGGERSSRGEKIFCVAHVHPGAARLGVEQPVIGGIAEPPGQSGKPLGLRREAFLRDGCCSNRTRAVHPIKVFPLIAESVHEPSRPTTQGANS